VTAPHLPGTSLDDGAFSFLGVLFVLHCAILFTFIIDVKELSKTSISEGHQPASNARLETNLHDVSDEIRQHLVLLDLGRIFLDLFLHLVTVV
jgi:hypothetical protein